MNANENKYVQEFYRLTCNQDIMDVVQPVDRQAKELSEAFGAIKQIRKIVLKHHNKDKNFRLYDFCAGNALVSVISCFLFPNIEKATAIDIMLRVRPWHKVQRFEYEFKSVHLKEWECMMNKRSIVVGVHACRGQAKRIIDIYNNSNAGYLILMPCCNGKMDHYNLPEVIKEKIGRYMMWSLSLFDQIRDSKKRMIVDENVMSPKNAILVAQKEWIK